MTVAAASDTATLAAAPKPAPSNAAAGAQKNVVRHTLITDLAPADEYFGPLKQSIIGINNTMRDLGRRYDVNHDIPTQTVSSAQLTERAIRDWAKKYPHDDQLPKSIYLLQRLYTKILTQDSRDRARSIASWLLGDFSRSPQAKQLKKTLAVEHLPPLPSPTPEAEKSPAFGSDFGSSYPSDFNASPAPGNAPTNAGSRGAAPATSVPPGSASPPASVETTAPASSPSQPAGTSGVEAPVQAPPSATPSRPTPQPSPR